MLGYCACMSVSQTDRSVIMIMTDDQLKDYLPQFGDRLALRYFCNRSVNTNNAAASNDTTKRKQSVLDRLRKKLCIRPPDATSSDCLNTSGDATVDKLSRASRKTSHKNALKNTRLVEICWINVDSTVRRRVKLADGGGIRKVSVAKNSKATDLMSVATSLFFPHGKSKFGMLSEFQCVLLDFREDSVKSHVTVGEMYDTSKLPLLRFHLQTTLVEQCGSVNVELSDDDSSLPDLYHIFCADDDVTVSQLTSGSSQGVVAQESMDADAEDSTEFHELSADLQEHAESIAINNLTSDHNYQDVLPDLQEHAESIVFIIYILLMLHFSITSSANSLLPKRARCGRMNNQFLLNARYIGAEVAGVQKIFPRVHARQNI